MTIIKKYYPSGRKVSLRSRLRLVGALQPALLLAGLLLASCSGHDHKESESDEHQHGDEIVFSEAQARAGGVATETVQPSTFREGIHTSGQVLGSLGDEMSIVARVSGVVTFAGKAVTEGMTVASGQPLFRVSTEGFADGDEVRNRRAEYLAALRELERGERLLADKLITEKELAALRLAVDIAKANSPASSGEGSAVVVGSPISGMVKSLRVRPGEYVESGTALAVVTKNRTLQLRAEVSEKYYNHLSHISGANFRLTGQDTVLNVADLGGRLVSYSHSTADDVCFVPVIFEFENRCDIVAGTFADVYLLGLVRDSIISVPVSALTEEQGVYYVYVKVDDDGYRKQEVEIGETDGQRREIVRGLKAGDEVVTKGAVLIKLASMSGAVPEGHSHNH